MNQKYLHTFRKSYIFKKVFYKILNNAIFGKTIQSTRKQRDTRLVINEKTRNSLVSSVNF